MYMTVKEAAAKWSISDRRIRVLCSEGKIPGAYHEGRGWKIPIDAEKPADGRFKSKESILTQIDRNKTELDGRRPLTEGELERLNEEFTVEYTYNSNAIEGNTLTLRETDLVLRGLTIDQKPLKDHEAGLTAILTPLSAVSMLVFSLLYTPCIAAVGAVRRELGGKWSVLLVLWQCGVAWLVALAVRGIGLLFGAG